MIEKLDLAALADEIEQPYRPARLAASGAFEASLFVCHDKHTWHRSEPKDQVLVVLEGVITIDGPGGRHVANEGEAVLIPGQTGHNLGAGMRSVVVLFRETPISVNANGHQVPPEAPRGEIRKVNVAAEVHGQGLFSWLALGTAGGCAIAATRLWGRSEPYRVPAGSLVLLVYRGLVDFTAVADGGDVAGSQMLVVPPDTLITLASERGATVVAAVRDGLLLPRPVAADSAARDADAGTTEP